MRARGDSRYERQTRLPQVGPAGQSRLGAARVLIIGCGATGGTIADHLARAGVGHLALVDRDLVERSNLHRQVLFDESNVGAPKAAAAAERLASINGSIQIEPIIADFDPRSAHEMLEVSRPTLLIDGTDNFETRFLLNDAAVRDATPLVIAGVLGVTGTVLPFVPGEGPCLRCVFDGPPDPGQIPTCESAGVLNAAVGVVAGFAAARAVALLVGGAVAPELLEVDVWSGRLRTIDLSGQRDPGCSCCARREFAWLDAAAPSPTALCGQNAVQVPATRRMRDPLDLDRLAERLAESGGVRRTPYFVRGDLDEHAEGIAITVFRDGRAIIHGTEDPARARVMYDRYVGR